MSSGTLGPNDVQEAFVTKLKGSPVASADPNMNIKEANWMGDEFVYPAVRVDNETMPFTQLNGNCYGQWFNILVSVYVYTEGTSSMECGRIMKLIGQLFGLGFVSSSLLRSQPLKIDHIPPIPVGDTIWRGQVIVTGRVKELI